MTCPSEDDLTLIFPLDRPDRVLVQSRSNSELSQATARREGWLAAAEWVGSGETPQPTLVTRGTLEKRLRAEGERRYPEHGGDDE